MNNIVVYALGKDTQKDGDRMYEVIVSKRCRSHEDIKAVVRAAKRDGYHSFRILQFKDNEKPDFVGTMGTSTKLSSDLEDAINFDPVPKPPKEAE